MQKGSWFALPLGSSS